MHTTRIAILHPTDPIGPIPGGIDTVIRGILKHAPPDLDYTLFGATSDLQARPVGKEIAVELGNRTARFLPLVAADATAERKLLPLSVRYMWELRRYLRTGLLRNLDIFDFHRVEPVALFRSDKRPKNLMLHQDMADIRNKDCDIGWRHAPWLYEHIERTLLRRVDRIFCVRQSAVDRYRALYPGLAGRFAFIPTWVDTALFYPSNDPGIRKLTYNRYAIPRDSQLLVSIGRLDRQKDPMLLLSTMGVALQKRPNLHLLIVGDGTLRPQVENRIRELGISEKVTLLGARQPTEVADLLRAADALIMSSAYEGMPIVMLEALATGVPVVTTRVGEVGRVVQTGVNGAVVSEHTAEALAAALCDTLANLSTVRGRACEVAVQPYYPDIVLNLIYDNHRRQSAAAAH